ncbi:peptide transport system permease protein SapC [Striga asiatica]|uniref:Peptide transport system permease protein SapC n=1 Tax=Striga asiatica TaxID=4170 RepID=A0A5A7PM08_STRAF|nr:peptide transport system permease protein SapC [Striga asiatica]
MFICNLLKRAVALQYMIIKTLNGCPNRKERLKKVMQRIIASSTAEVVRPLSSANIAKSCLRKLDLHAKIPSGFKAYAPFARKLLGKRLRYKKVMWHSEKVYYSQSYAFATSITVESIHLTSPKFTCDLSPERNSLTSSFTSIQLQPGLFLTPFDLLNTLVRSSSPFLPTKL